MENDDTEKDLRRIRRWLDTQEFWSKEGLLKG